MKTPSFWYRPPNLITRLLSPLGQAYRAAGLLRRAFAKPYKASVPVICIGNIVAGGAGKTPTAIAIAKRLQHQGAKPVFVSRGYGGCEKGPLRVDSHVHTAHDVGDEALLLAQIAPCWISHYRPSAIRKAEAEATHIILDDGLQNPTFTADVNILVIDGEVGLGNGHLIPIGPLRETLADALPRVDAIVVIGGGEELPFSFPSFPQENGIFLPLEGRVREGGVTLGDLFQNPQQTSQPYPPLPNPPLKGEGTRAIPIIRAQLRPHLPDDFPRDRNFIAFAGIGRPEKFYRTCREAGLNIIATQDFPDHHVFTKTELAALFTLAATHNALLLTTSKDWVRLPKRFREGVWVLGVGV